MDATDTSTRSEVERVISWRWEELRRAGYDDALAEKIAGRMDVDLHEAIALTAAGCPPETAARILL